MMNDFQDHDEVSPNDVGHFNLEKLLSGDGCDAMHSSSFRQQSSKMFGKGSHRRRRPNTLSSVQSNGLSSKRRQRDFSDNPPQVYSRGSNVASDAIPKKLTIPLMILIFLVFWGPILLQSNQPQDFIRGGRRTLMNVRQGETVADGLDIEDSEDTEVDETGDQEGSGIKLGAPILKALQEIQNEDFQLPRGDQESDDRTNALNLSDESQVRQEIPKVGIGGFALNVLDKSKLKQNHKKLSPLEQYQIRTQEEEETQLRRFEEQQQNGNRQGYQLDQIAQHELDLRQKEKEVAQELWQKKQEEVQEQQRLQQLELQRQVLLQQNQLEQDKLELAKLQKEKQSSERLKQNVESKALQFAYKHADNPKLIPSHFDTSLANVWDPILPTDTALFFHIPKSGGTTVADIMTHCLDLVTASSIGASEGHGSENTLKVRRYHDKGRYVNVNPASLEGIRRAKELGLAASGLADVVVLHRLHEGTELFNPRYKGRLFCMFRNPVHRAVSMFYYLQKATWEPTYDPTLADMTLLDYANSNKVEENWVTRFLVHEYTGRLTKDAVAKAKAIMRNKMIVGVLGNFQESLKRFELYFDWWADSKKKGSSVQLVQCQQNQARVKQNKVSHPLPGEKDPAYKRLMQLNWADMELYTYAVQLFHEQAELVSHKDASLL